MASKRVKLSSKEELKRLETRFLKWKGSKECSKYVELCFNLGASFYFNAESEDAWNQADDKALETFQIGVNIASKIKYKLSFDQMTDYGRLLYWKEDRNESTPATKRKPLEWFLYCLKTAKRLKQKQICIIEIYLGMSYFLCQEYSQASKYFLKGLEYKVSNIENDLLGEFFTKGAECMKILKKPKAYLKIMTEAIYVDEDIDGIHVENLIKMFDLDVKIHKKKKGQDCPYFERICYCLKRECNVDKYLNVFFCIVLIKNKLITNLIPTLLDE